MKNPSQQNHALFRSEVLEHLKYRHFGSAFLNIPWHYNVATIGSFFILIIFIVWLTCGRLSERCTVLGVLNTSPGISHVYPQANGTIIKQYIHLGMHVNRGDPLFTINTSKDGYHPSEKHKLIKHLQDQIDLINHTIHQKKQMLIKLKPLLDKQFISILTYQNKENEISELLRQLIQLKIDILKYKHEQAYTLYAPLNGTITTLLSEKGHHVTQGKPIVHVLPDHARLIAQLYIPTHRARFLDKNTTISLRYDAYPYQHFGTAKARIIEISQTAVTDDEEQKPFRVGQSYYKAKALIENQSVRFQGKEHPLHAGMTLTAVLHGPMEMLWRWLLKSSKGLG